MTVAARRRETPGRGADRRDGPSGHPSAAGHTTRRSQIATTSFGQEFLPTCAARLPRHINARYITVHMQNRVPWSRDELLVTFRLYCRTRLGRLHRIDPEVMALSWVFAHSASAVAMEDRQLRKP